MFDEEKSNEELAKLIESISDDLFLVKLELKITRIDELLGKNDGFDEIEDNLTTPFQRMFFCHHWLKRCVYWSGDRDEANKAVDQLFNNFRVGDSVKRDSLIHYIETTFDRRNRLIEAIRKTVSEGEVATRDYRKNEMAQFEHDKKGLSRIEALERLNRIEWICEVMKQMESHFNQHKNLNNWTYQMPLDWGCKDERTALDF